MPAAATGVAAESWIDVRIEGLEKELASEVRESLAIVRHAGHESSKDAPVARRLHNLALEQIRLVLTSHGYYRARVTGSLEAEGVRWRARYKIEPGVPVHIKTLQVRVSGPGGDDPELEKVRRSFPLKAGAALDEDAYERGKSALLRTARARGYLAASFAAHVVTVDIAAYEASVDLVLDTGARSVFGPITFRQQVFSERFLGRFAPFHSGDYYDTRLLGRLQRRLSESGLFKGIQVNARTDAADGLAVPVEVDLEPNAPNRYRTAIGYGTDQGAWLRLNYLRRWINSSGHSVRSDLEWAERTALAQVIYRIPLTDPLHQSLTSTARWDREDTDDTSRETTSLLFMREYDRRQHGYRAGVHWLHEDYQAGTGAPNGSSTLFMPTLAWKWTSAPDPVWVSRGYSLAGRVTGAVDGFLSDATLAQGAGEAKLIWPLGRNGRVLARASVGFTSIDDIDELPVSLRFFAGGSLSVRGYDYKSLGPRDENGDVIGGRHMITASVEYEHRVRKNLYAAVFFDAGDAFDAFNDAQPDLKRGAGIGLRYALPFGMVRLDLATALDRDGQPWRVHFSMGPDL